MLLCMVDLLNLADRCMIIPAILCMNTFVHSCGRYSTTASEVQGSTDEESDAPSNIQQRIDEYNARVRDEGEMSDSEACEVDKFLSEQESEDDKLWTVCPKLMAAVPGFMCKLMAYLRLGGRFPR